MAQGAKSARHLRGAQYDMCLNLKNKIGVTSLRPRGETGRHGGVGYGYRTDSYGPQVRTQRLGHWLELIQSLKNLPSEAGRHIPEDGMFTTSWPTPLP